MSEWDDIFQLAGGTIQANASQYIKQQGTATASAMGYKPSGSKTTRLIHRGSRIRNTACLYTYNRAACYT